MHWRLSGPFRPVEAPIGMISWSSRCADRLGCFSSAPMEGRGRGRWRADGLSFQGGPSDGKGMQFPRAPAIVCRQRALGGFLDLLDRQGRRRNGRAVHRPIPPAPCLPVSATRDLALVLALTAWTTALRRTQPLDRIAPRAAEDRDWPSCGGDMGKISRGRDKVGMSGALSPSCFRVWALRLLGTTLCGRIWVPRNC